MTVTLTGRGMRNYVAADPFTAENRKAVIQAIGCIDKNEDPYPTG